MFHDAIGAGSGLLDLLRLLPPPPPVLLELPWWLLEPLDEPPERPTILLKVDMRLPIPPVIELLPPCP